MDLTPFKRDIDELLDDFTQSGSTTFTDFKRVWLSRMFSYLYEGRPKSKTAVFMQALYAHCICHMISKGSLSKRCGGLYCLYCLYETQPSKPHFRIYLCLGELKRLKDLVVDAKQNNIDIVPAIVKRMVERNMFLYGFVDIVDTSVNQRVDEIMKLQNKHVQVAYEKLFSNTRIDDYLHMDLGMELDLNGLQKMSTDYAKAKEHAIHEAGEMVDVNDMKHIVENNDSIGNRIEAIVEDWDAQKEAFCRQTGIICGNEIVVVDDFDKELEHLLNEE